MLAEKGLHTIKYWKQEQPRTMFERPSRPVIEYPCPWEYKVIGENESAMRQAVADVMIDINHKVTFSHTSRTGKYCSLLVALIVADEDERTSLFTSLKAHPAIMMVL